KTVVALHRAAYLLYTHRFPLEGQGVLVVGPNRLFLSYIDQVLPSLGEAGVHTAVIGDLIPNTRVAGADPLPVARIKGDVRMVPLVRKAVKDRQRALREPLVVPFGVQRLRLSVAESRNIIADVRRRVRNHNAGRRHVEDRVFGLLAERSRQPISPEDLRSRIRTTDEVRYALEWMWPVLSPSELLNDLYSSRALLRSAAGGRLTDDELALLLSPRHDDASARVWAFADAPILDEALVRLGPRPKHRQSEVVRTYGHILVDEAQDLSPMELRSLSRRSLGGSMTVVGDIAQATSPWAHDSWDDVIAGLPQRRPSRTVELRTGYRLPGPIMELASRLLPLAAPGLEAPSSIREHGETPVIEAVTGEGPGFGGMLVAAVRREVEAVDRGSVAVVCTGAALDRCERALSEAGVGFGRANRHGLDQQVTVVEVRMVKGLELDSVIVVEPADIIEADDRGAQALYVALTRSTRRLSLLHERPLPAVLRG
ncbi:MAG: ATP-binding domain-containing protein, partial [Microthrixaceae bacterium]|nr:ATP-binding domain-containing protein [Microthrixaceae bacterium]